MATAVHMAIVAGSTQNRAIAFVIIELQHRRKGYAALATGDGVPHDGLEPLPVEEKGEAVAAVEQHPALVAALRHGEARGRDAVRRVQRGIEDGDAEFAGEQAEEGRFPVVGAEAAEENGVGDEAASALADEFGAGEGGGLRREAEEDLPEEIVVVRQERRRGGGMRGGGGSSNPRSSHLERGQSRICPAREP